MCVCACVCRERLCVCACTYVYVSMCSIVCVSAYYVRAHCGMCFTVEKCMRVCGVWCVCEREHKSTSTRTNAECIANSKTSTIEEHERSSRRVRPHVEQPTSSMSGHKPSSKCAKGSTWYAARARARKEARKQPTGSTSSSTSRRALLNQELSGR